MAEDLIEGGHEHERSPECTVRDEGRCKKDDTTSHEVGSMGEASRCMTNGGAANLDA